MLYFHGMGNKLNELSIVMDALMSKYAERVPDVSKIVKDLIGEGVVQDASEISNDHIAFRTMGVPHLGIASLEKIFLYYGYTKKDHYVFESKKLDAYWYAPPAEEFPRIFISELRVEKLSPEAQNIIQSYTNEVTSDPVDNINLNDPHIVGAFLHQSLWR
ncbi:MAG: 2-oxoadipate dioxygenase/decarboxylase family protein, partial [Chitinophagaceae bacterium]